MEREAAHFRSSQEHEPRQKSDSVVQPPPRLIRGGTLPTRRQPRKRVLEATAYGVIIVAIKRITRNRRDC